MRRLSLPALALLACAHDSARPPAGLGEHPALVVETLDGERRELGGPGPVRLVEMWATWCVPCAPAAERARRVLARHPTVVAYAVALDADREAVRQRLAADPPPGEQFLYPGGAGAAMRRGLATVPMFIALDVRGRVVGTLVGDAPGLGPALDRLLREALGEAGSG